MSGNNPCRHAAWASIIVLYLTAAPAHGQSVAGTWWCEVSGMGTIEYQVATFSYDGSYQATTQIPGISRGQYSGRWLQQGATVYMSIQGQVCTQFGCQPVSDTYPLSVVFGNNGAIMWTNFGTCVSPMATLQEVLPNHPSRGSRMRVQEEGSISRWFRKWGPRLRRIRP